MVQFRMAKPAPARAGRLVQALVLAAFSAVVLSCAHSEAPVPLTVPVVAALCAETDSILFEGGQFFVDGCDHNPNDWSVLADGTAVLGIATTGDPAKIESRLRHSERNNIDGLGGFPSINQVAGGLRFDDLADRYAKAADIAMPAGAYSNVAWGGLDDGQVVWIAGDFLAAENISGAGVLVVDGDFACTGVFTWFGLILVRGDMSLSVSSGGGVHILGSILIKGGGGQELISGNVDVFYSSQAIRRVNDLNRSRPGLHTLIWDAP